MAQINIHGLRLDTILGFWPEERTQKQRVIIHVTFEIDEKEAVAKDAVDFAVDYQKLVEEIIEKVPVTEFNLIEKLTQFVVDIVMSRKRVKYTKVVVEKPDAPVRFIDGISCMLEARR
jgi:FolB domain-containing protein